MKTGDTVSWNGVNGVVTGTVDEYAGNGEWYVTLTNGKSMIVNESSFIDHV